MLFPSYKNQISGYLNLDTEARLWMQQKGLPIHPNPLIDPVICQQMVDEVHQKYGLDYSYGGWFEDRSFLWNGSYLDRAGTYTHLGVDFNVPAYTEIALDFEGMVVKVADDHPLEGGWGPHVVVQHSDTQLFFIFAHLDREILCQVGDIIKTDQIFARVGKAPLNGNWFSHLHLQTIAHDFYVQMDATNTFDLLDGYCLTQDIHKNASLFRDPLPFVNL